MEKRFTKNPSLLECSRLLWVAAITLLVALLLSPPSLSAQEGKLLSAQERDWLSAHPSIGLAPDPDYPPIEYFDENRVYRGIAADYVALIEKKLGFQFKIVHLQSWDEALTKAKSRQIDMFGAAAETPQRSEYMLFTHPFIEFPSVIIVRKSVSEQPLSLQKLNGMRVAVVSGYADHDYIKNHYPGLQIDEVPTVATGLRKVSFGMVDALVTNLASATYYIEKEGITNLRLAGNTGYQFRLGFGVRSDWPELVTILEKGLAQIAPGEREAIFNKWVQLENVSLWGNRRVRVIALSGLGVVIFLLVALSLWNRSLKSAVSLRTQELNKELAERKRTEEALRQSEERYRGVVQNTTAVILRIDPKGIVRFANKRALDLFGYSADELIGRHVVGTIIPKRETTGRDLAAMVEEVAANPDHFHSNINENMKKSGERVWMEWTNSGIYDAESNLMEFLAVGIDATDRKRAEEALRQSERRYRILHETLRDAFVQVSMDGRIIEFNDLFCEMLGYSPEEICSLTYQQVTPERWHAFEERIVREQIIARGYSNVYEKEYRRKDGTIFPVELRTILSTDESGLPNAMWGIARDITERKRAEDALHQAVERYERQVRLFEGVATTTPDFVYVFDPQGRFLYANERLLEVWGMKLPEVIGKTCRELGYEQWQHDMHMEEIAQVIATKRPIKGEVPFKAPLTGIFGVYEYIFTPVVGPDGEVEFIAGTSRDITERKRMEDELRKSRDELELRVRQRTAELERANAELKSFPSRLISVQEEERKRLASELHDSIGQTLAALKFNVEFMLVLRDRGEAEEAFKHLEQFVPTLQRSIDETRSIYTGLRPKMLEEMGVVATLQWFRREFMRLYPTQHVELEIGLEEGDVPEDLKIVIFRITQESLNNISKHSKAEWVDVSLQKNGGSIDLTVSDDGVGMDLAYILESRTARSLGLTAMRERAELTGGAFSIESTPGEGTTVRVLWPAAVCRAEAPTSHQEQRTTPLGGFSVSYPNRKA